MAEITKAYNDIKNALTRILNQEGIESIGFIPLSQTTLQKPYLLEYTEITVENGTAVLMVAPYYTSFCDQKRNISAYAVSRDYHLFWRELSQKILFQLEQIYPQYIFKFFSDHSPILEVPAAVKAGLGLLGDNGLLLTPKWSSYVFLASIITNAPIESRVFPIKFCEHCGNCKNACPAFLSQKGPLKDTCLSALTQQKQDWNEVEKQAIMSHSLIWGCDICQEHCPHTISARKKDTLYTTIPFFWENAIPYLTYDKVAHMTDEEFSTRAFSWRGKKVVLRNLALWEETNKND